jgi:23S rRNA (cytosine1962-C5)-methyltransferase
MFAPDQYQLLDFGGGRRLERFAGWVLDRPAPAAERMPRIGPDVWRAIHARFVRGENDDGRWEFRAISDKIPKAMPQRWAIAHAGFQLELKCSPFGHLGVFPEQAENWDWIAQQVRAAGRPLKVLNLFAYTGGSTLAAASAGAEVTHVDAARNTVGHARRNAELSGMADAPIRWIAEDAQKFVSRELRRGNGYDAVILDPPSYGHGTRGEVWRLSQHLPKLLAMCDELTKGRGSFILLTCHTPGFGHDELLTMAREALGTGCHAGQFFAEPLSILAATGKRLPSGMSVRWKNDSFV